MPGKALVALLALAVSPLAAAGSTQSAVFERIATEQELANANVSCALQTRDGFLWVGTGGGLARYDGVHFTSYRPAGVPAFPSPVITCLMEDRAGDLWIGTTAGLVRRHGGQFENLGLAGLNVSAVVQDPSGTIWIGTHEKGLFRLTNGAVQPSGITLASRFVVALHADAEGRLWASLGGGVDGVGRIDHGQFTLLYAGADELGDRVEAVTEAPAGVLWLGTHARGLFELHGGALRQIGRDRGVTLSEVSDLEPAKGGGVWAAGGAVVRIHDPEVPHGETLAPAATQNVSRVIEDLEGSLWLSAREEGLFRARPFPFRLVSSRDGLPDNIVRTVSEDQSGNLWLPIQHHGVARVSPDGSVRRYGRAEGLPDEEPSVALGTSDGTVWIGTNQALQAWRDGTPTPYPNLLAVRALFEDSKHTLWIGTESHGVVRRAQGLLTPVQAPAPLNHATSFAEEPDGTIDIGLWAGGLARLQDGVVKLQTRASGLPDDEVRALCCDREGNLWAGFRSHGLGLLRQGRWWNPDTLSEELANHVSAIIDDEQGRLWLGTAAGIVWIWKNELLAAADGGPVPEVHVTELGEGPRPLQVWSGGQPTVWRTHAGLLAFATRQGALLIDPVKIPQNTTPPPVVIETIEADGKARPAVAPVRLAAGTRQFTVRYTALSFVQPNRVAFRYQLEGYDEARITGPARVAHYGNLPPGRYTFRVSASNNDGVWNETGAALVVIQEPHFYQTGWFYGFAAVLLLGGAFLLYRWSVRRLECEVQKLEEKNAMDRERQRIAKALHDDLGADLTEIGLFAGSALQSDSLPRALDEVAQLSEKVRAITGSLDTIVWAVNPANDSLDSLAGYLCDYFQGIFRRTAIRCRVDRDEELPAYPLTPDARSNLFLTAKEAIHNIVRHSRATEARLALATDPQGFHLTISDNGCGFDLNGPEARRRNGLANMASRSAELGGTVDIESAPGHGTVIRIHLPLPFHAHPSRHR